jgi:membrane-associated phospholipid phosphatase
VATISKALRTPFLVLAFALTFALCFPGGAEAREDPPPPGIGVSTEDPSRTASSDEARTPPPDPQAPESGGIDPGPHPHGLHQIRLDARYFLTKPFHLDRKGWLKVAATLGTAALLYADRQGIQNTVQNRATASGESFLEKPRTMGKGAFAPSLALISYGASFATHDDREKETAVLLMESMAFSGLTAGIGQFVLSSERPDQGDSVHFFRWGGHGVSGDAALAASVVPVLKHQYLRVRPGDGGGLRAWKRTAIGFLYTGAILTGYQRIYSDKHWAPDAFLGLVSGFTVGQILCDSHDQAREGAGSRARLAAVPGGIGMRWTF